MVIRCITITLDHMRDSKARHLVKPAGYKLEEMINGKH